ncbi:DNA gyrase inhibitor YacG, partial [Chromobacterium piscinae]
MAESIRIVACPTCRAEVRWEAQSRYRPFCSERCRLIDLGQWASENYRVPAEED